MRLHIANIDENKRIVAGTVTEVKPGTGSGEGKVVNVTIEGTVWNKETEAEETKKLEIAFWNNDVVQMADRVTKAGVSVGSLICVEVYEKDGKCTGNNFMYRGRFTIPATDISKEKTVLMGVISSLNEGTTSSGNKYARASMPIDVRKGEEPEWVSITFWNSETSNVADRAMKVLQEREGKKSKAIVICGEPREYNGKPQYTGWEFLKY